MKVTNTKGRETRRRRVYSGAVSTALLLAALLALTSAASAAGPPIITQTTVSAVTATSATLDATLDPNGSRVNAHFAYVDQDTFNKSGFSNAQLTSETTVQPTVKGQGDLQSGSNIVSNLDTSVGTFYPGQTIKGTGVPSGTVVTTVGRDSKTGNPQLTLSKLATATNPSVSLTATGPEPVSIPIAGLNPATQYRFELQAENSKGESTTGPEGSFSTFATPPVFGPCPNQELRSGGPNVLLPADHPSAGLPDCRAYEQSSPVDKNGSNIFGEARLTKAAADGSAITFGALFGIPGGTGAQEYPYYLASRGLDRAGWSTSGLKPPATTGQRAQVLIGWLPDFTATYAEATRLGDPRVHALYELHSDGSAPTMIAPYTPLPSEFLGALPYSFLGASADGSTVLIEASGRLPAAAGEPPIPGSLDETFNLYAWSRASGRLSLAGVMNTDAETAELLPKGAVGGPYNWLPTEIAPALLTGGSSAVYYTREERAVGADGSVFFTALGSGQLYQRLNPTAPQSNPGPGGYVEDGHCAEPQKACTISISASQKTNGGPAHNGPDPAGTAPAAFQAAASNGSSAFFTSSEELTNDANTGPEQPLAEIGRATLTDPAPDATKEEDFQRAHALGTALSQDGEYLYWADPTTGNIDRDRLGSNGEILDEETDYIVPGPIEAEARPVVEPGVLTSAPSNPRYIAVGPCAGGGECLYWTNTGPLGSNRGGDGGFTQHLPVNKAGTIGRARVGSSQATEVDSEFITGASNPQGIAVNESHIYWGDVREALPSAIARAALDGSSPEMLWEEIGNPLPGAITLSSTSIYFGVADRDNPDQYIYGIPLSGGHISGKENEQDYDIVFVQSARNGEVPTGLAVDSSYLYWAGEGAHAIGRISLTSFHSPHESFGCSLIADCEPTYLHLSGGVYGLTVGGSRLYYSINGTSPPNPGNDLYSFQPATKTLTDLTADPAGNGAEVQGVIGTSVDGSYVYFVANGDLDGAAGATEGDCQREASNNYLGSCNIYLFHAGQSTFIARLSGKEDSSDWFARTSNFGSDNKKTGSVSPDGRTLAFFSAQRLTSYDTHGTTELYRYRAGEPGSISCASCNPTGAPPTSAPAVGTLQYPGIGINTQGLSAVPNRFLTADGERVFFETAEALNALDTNGVRDVYEWEAPGFGTCQASGPAYSPLNEGCLYLISTGNSSTPSFFADASESGDDVFFFTPEPLVGQDQDGLQDVYDARVEGGLAAQNPLPAESCQTTESCHGPPSSAPEIPTALTPLIHGPGDLHQARCPAGKVRRRGRCHKKRSSKRHHKKHHPRAHHDRGGRR